MSIGYLIYLLCGVAMTHLFQFYLRKNKELTNLVKSPKLFGEPSFPALKLYFAIVLSSGCFDVLYFALFHKISGIFWMLPFFYIQCYSDIKERMVYIVVNRLFLAFCAILFLTSGQYICFLNPVLCLFILLPVGLLFLAVKLNRMGMGDFITMLGFFCFYLSTEKNGGGVLNFFYFVLFSNLSLGIYAWIRYRKVEKKSRKKLSVAFYPFMLLGYFITLLARTVGL